MIKFSLIAIKTLRMRHLNAAPDDITVSSTSPREDGDTETEVSTKLRIILQYLEMVLKPEIVMYVIKVKH